MKYIVILSLFCLSFKINDIVPKENLVGTWERVCLENSALGFSLNHCNYFGDKIMTIKEWNYIEVEYKNGQRRFIDYLLEEDKIKFFSLQKKVLKVLYLLKMIL